MVEINFLSMNRLRSSTALAGLAALVFLAACGANGQPAETTIGSETTTTTPNKVVLYSGRSEDLIAPLIARFEEKTGTEVEVRYAGSGELATTLLQEGTASPADAFYSQDPAFIGAVGAAGLLRTLPSTVLSLVPERFSDRDGSWVGITARSRVLVYNPELLTEPQLPETVWDLTDPVWKGRLGIAPTNGSFVAFVAAMMLTDGEERTLEWLRGIAANQAVPYEKNSPIVAAVDAGDIPAGLVNHYYLLRLRSEQGGSTAVNYYFKSGDPGALVMPTGAGILVSAQNPDGARELIEFLLSAEAQAYFLEEVFEYPLIEGAGTPEGQTPLADLPTPDINLSDLASALDRATELIAEAGLT